MTKELAHLQQGKIGGQVVPTSFVTIIILIINVVVAITAITITTATTIINTLTP